MSCRYATWDGSYVLGALSPAEHEEYERHLEQCRGCAEAVRAMAGLPGLLSRAGERDLVDPVDPGPVPATVLPALVREVRRAQRRRAALVAGLAAASTAAAATVGVVLADGPSGSDAPGAVPSAGASDTGSAAGARAMAAVDGAPVQGWLTLEEVAWGTRLSLQCTYGVSTQAGGPDRYGGPTDGAYVMVVRTTDGVEQQVATWRAVTGRPMQLEAASAARLDQIASVEVRTDTGRPVLRLRG